ncbi:histone H4 transcription factor isoform X2 [Malaya genurostris]|uniref:histone H4 transcription factor isoform X2 n=1 Tax=Malaya genurostris TaxID=325434 RepID=UPI0026F38BE1|nr:histone H4 transcription factor isoform X2 [Malaya genurostris]
MGRKRKSKAPVKITRSPKQAKQSATPVKKDVTSTDDGSNNPVKKNSPKVSDPVQLDDVTEQQETADGKKSWDRVRQWMIDQQQQQADEPDAKVALEEIADEEPLTEDRYPLADDSAHLNEDFEVPLRYRLKDYTEKQILNSVMYECEWLKCGLETTDDIEYLTHVESHLDSYLQGRRDFRDLTCLWDLCDFKTSSVRDLESHVHFHVYHNRMKTHGASLSNIISVPKCNNDSRRRNSIDTFRITFQCEWGDCEEVYHKAQSFFTHVNNHIQDQFPVDKRSSKVPLMCQWAACKQTYKRCSIGLEHIRRHSTERTIGCYTCGAMFVSRLKYIDHCKRQVEYHNREYPCQQCNKLFATKQLMVDHTNIHNKKYACTLCPMKWPSRKALSYHIRYRHVEDKPFQCHICNHRCVTKGDLNEHVLTHDERRMFRCEEFGCDVAYKCQKSLRKHVDSVHYGMGPMKYACHLCENHYCSGANLSRHLMKTHQYRKPPGYSRFMYQADRDGVFRLSTYVTGEIVSYSDDECKSEAQSQDSSAVPIKEDNEEEVQTWTSFSIGKLETMARNTIAIELKANEVLPKASRSMPSLKKSDSRASLPGPKDEPSSSAKSVDDFTVMKRYIKEEKTVVISFEETDSAGSVIRSETVQTTELTPDKLLSSGRV